MVIVSLTTTSQRLKLCVQTLISLSSQKNKPDKISLWVSQDPYLRDQGVSPEHPLLKEIDEYLPLVEIRWTDNTGPYRKLLPTLHECTEDDLVIMVDDDVIYGRDWLCSMIDEHNLFPDSVIATRVRNIKRNKIKRETTYTQWPLVKNNRSIDHDFVITGAGGVLFKREFFRKSDIMNKDFTEVCPTADDLWFSRILEKNGVSVRCLATSLEDVFFIEHNEGLIRMNSRDLNTRLKQFTFWLVYKRLGNLGFSVCKNDVLYKQTKRYFSNDKMVLGKS
jgi:hypothetical protein